MRLRVFVDEARVDVDEVAAAVSSIGATPVDVTTGRGFVEVATAGDLSPLGQSRAREQILRVIENRPTAAGGILARLDALETELAALRAAVDEIDAGTLQDPAMREDATVEP